MALDGAYKIKVIEGADTGAEIELTGDSIRLVIGDATELKDGVLTVKGKSSCGACAALNWEESSKAYRVSNRSAFSPIAVNGVDCANALMTDGTVIRIGGEVIQVEAADEIAAAVPAEPVKEIGTVKTDENVYLGAAPSKEGQEKETPVWLRCGDDALAVNTSIESAAGYISPENIARIHAEAEKAGLNPELCVQAVRDNFNPVLYCQAVAAGMDPALYCEAAEAGVEAHIYAKALSLGLDPKLYSDAITEGIDPYIYSQAAAEGYDPRIYVEALERGFDPYIYAKAASEGIDPYVYNQALMNGYEPHVFAQNLMQTYIPGVNSQEYAAVPVIPSSPGTFGGAENYWGGDYGPGGVPADGSFEQPPYGVYMPPAAPEAAVPVPRALGHICVTNGANIGRETDVYGSFTIGRSTDNDFVLSDPQVSRRHCSVQFLEDGVFLINHSTSSTTKIGQASIRTRGPLPSECDIILANKVFLHWKCYI